MSKSASQMNFPSTLCSKNVIAKLSIEKAVPSCNVSGTEVASGVNVGDGESSVGVGISRVYLQEREVTTNKDIKLVLRQFFRDHHITIVPCVQDSRRIARLRALRYFLGNILIIHHDYHSYHSAPMMVTCPGRFFQDTYR
ncbi:MAG: hypothetical protein ISS57_17830, partial [Anaerolineales bacterium]|nr:hypothetical protein [Anaerolineales bacterium]